jgi:mannose-1-phosphate guanylyltransferase
LINLHAHANIVRDAVDRIETGVTVHLSEERLLLGSAGTLLANREWLAGESGFWILYADVLTTLDFAKMQRLHSMSNMAATIGLYQVDDPTRCGIVTFDSRGVVRLFEEKPAHPRSDWAFSGIMIATQQLLDAIPSRTPVDLGYDVLPELAGRMLAYPISDYLLDIGTMRNYELAQRTWPGLGTQEADGNASK